MGPHFEQKNLPPGPCVGNSLCEVPTGVHAPFPPPANGQNETPVDKRYTEKLDKLQVRPIEALATRREERTLLEEA